MPRHPPCALHSLSHKHSTKTTKDTPHHRHNHTSSRATTKQKTTTHQPTRKKPRPAALVVARCSRPLSTYQTPHPPTPTPHHHGTDQGKEAQKKQTPPPPHRHPPSRADTTRNRGVAGLIPQGPTACQNQPPTHRTPRFHTHHHHSRAAAAGSTEEARRARRRRSSMIPLVNTTNASHTDGGCAGRVLLRKEVIQPHLPVRLPCYDFVPIASPTFDGSPHKGWATGFGCCRLS